MQVVVCGLVFGVCNSLADTRTGARCTQKFVDTYVWPLRRERLDRG